MYDVLIQLTWQILRIRKYSTVNLFPRNCIGGSLSFFLHNALQFLSEFKGGKVVAIDTVTG